MSGSWSTTSIALKCIFMIMIFVNMKKYNPHVLRMYVHVLAEIQATYTNDTTTLLMPYNVFKQMYILCTSTSSHHAVPARTDQIERTGVRVREEINAKHADCLSIIGKNKHFLEK